MVNSRLWLPMLGFDVGSLSDAMRPSSAQAVTVTWRFSTERESQLSLKVSL
jgi:hypothetical protein